MRACTNATPLTSWLIKINQLWDFWRTLLQGPLYILPAVAEVPPPARGSFFEEYIKELLLFFLFRCYSFDLRFFLLKPPFLGNMWKNSRRNQIVVTSAVALLIGITPMELLLSLFFSSFYLHFASSFFCFQTSGRSDKAVVCSKTGNDMRLGLLRLDPFRKMFVSLKLSSFQVWAESTKL